MTELINKKLGELVKAGGGKIHTGPFGSQLHASDYVEAGIPCIMPANMKDNRVDLSDIAFITEKDANRLSKYVVEDGDIVYSRRGDVTQKALIREAEAGYFCGTGCLLLRPGSELDSDFLIYYLSIPAVQKWIVKQAVGATMPNLNTGILASIPFQGPVKSTQEKISPVLTAINKKIELNNRINIELEAMAKTLYDYWFVQFDFPFDFTTGKPDINGKPYKSSGGKMVYNPTLKREIPEGWEIRFLSDIAPVLTGKEDANFATKQGSYSYFTCGEEVLSCDHFKFDGTAVLVAGNGNFNVKIFNGKFNAYQRTYVLMPYNDDLFATLYYSVRNQIDAITKGSRGSIVKFMTKGDLADINIIFPAPTDTYLSLLNYPSRLLLSTLIYKKENQQLTALRDWLLPMLMNGQVTVKS